MECLINEYGEEIAPFAVQLCNSLKESFFAIMAETDLQNNNENSSSSSQNADDKLTSDESAEKLAAATGVLSTVTTMLVNLESSKETVAQVEEVLLPIIVHILQNEISGENIRSVILTIHICLEQHVPMQNYHD